MKRPPWRITLAVWHALLLREATARLFSRRAAFVWLLVEPAAQIAFMTFVFSVLRARHIGGMEAALWLSSGMLAFFLFRRSASQGAAAVSANFALYTYRQVKPVDTVLTRCMLECLLTFAISALLMAALALLGVQLQLHAPLQTLSALLGLWLLSVGWGLAASVARALVPELGNLLGLLMMPLMLISGVIFPLSAIPTPWREWIMLNPVAHGVEGVRASISPYYHFVPELNLMYLHGCALVLVFFGLSLQLHYQSRLVAR